jgi:hypothetical protein
LLKSEIFDLHRVFNKAAIVYQTNVKFGREKFSPGNSEFKTGDREKGVWGMGFGV